MSSNRSRPIGGQKKQVQSNHSRDVCGTEKELVAIAENRSYNRQQERLLALEQLATLSSDLFTSITPTLRQVSRFAREAEVRKSAVVAAQQGLGKAADVAPTADRVLAILAAQDDPEEVVRQAASSAIEQWATSSAQASAGTRWPTIRGSSDCGGSSRFGGGGRFRLQDSLIRIIICPMSQNSDREQRIDAVAAHRPANVRGGVTDPDDRREAEAKAAGQERPKRSLHTPNNSKPLPGSRTSCALRPWPGSWNRGSVNIFQPAGAEGRPSRRGSRAETLFCRSHYR